MDQGKITDHRKAEDAEQHKTTTLNIRVWEPESGVKTMITK
jgi:hypothetical protein